jgi:hypothetical protein
MARIPAMTVAVLVLTGAATAEDAPLLGSWFCETPSQDGEPLESFVEFAPDGKLSLQYQQGSVTFSGSGSWRLQDDGVTLTASGVKCDGPHCENSQMDPFEATVRMTGPGELMLSEAHCTSETSAQNAQSEGGSGEEENRQANAQQFLEGLGQILGGIAALQNNGDNGDSGDDDNGYGNNNYGNGDSAPSYNAPPSRRQRPYVDQTAEKAKKIASLRYVLAMYKRALHSAEQSLKVNEKSPHIGYWQMQVRHYEQKVSETEAKLAALE